MADDDKIIAPEQDEHLRKLLIGGDLDLSAHLDRLREVSTLFADATAALVDMVPRNGERTIALRKLIEARDAAVRAVIAGDL